MPWIPSCFDCEEAEIDPGDPGCHTLPNGDPGWPGEPASVVGCKFMGDEYWEDEDNKGPEDARTCSHFKPRMIEKCGVCKEPINQPAYYWNTMAPGEYESVPVCSHRCEVNLFLKESIYRWKDELRAWKLKTGQLEEYSVFYCPCCELELQPFTDFTSWWIRESSGILMCYCEHCEQEVRPEERGILIRHQMSYREALTKMGSKKSGRR